MAKLTLMIEYTDEEKECPYVQGVKHVYDVPKDLGTIELLRAMKTFMVGLTYEVRGLAILDQKGKKILWSSEDDLL